MSVINGNGFANILNTGTLVSDTFNGLDGNDTISTGSGGAADTVFGGEGNDLITAGNTFDLLNGDAGNDTLMGWAGFEYLYGGDGADVISTGAGGGETYGGGNYDTLTGGAGVETLDGGEGDDVYVGVSLADMLVELVNGGEDRIETGITWTLSAEFENLTLTVRAQSTAQETNLPTSFWATVPPTGCRVLGGGIRFTATRATIR